ncbi:MAG: TonB family protein [Acidobacteriota bacterium]
MKRISLQRLMTNQRGAFAIAFAMAVIFALGSLTSVVRSQTPNQLSLADILIDLRSHKLTLPERNKILTDAVETRGTTFSLSPEIEKELSVTGADKDLVDAIRKRSQIVKINAVVPPTETKPKAEPVVQPPPPDFSFYEKRANASFAKGDTDAALTDYSKAIEMNASSIGSLLGRAAAYLKKGSYVQAIADCSKMLELNPKSAVAYSLRGEVYEQKGDAALASADYKKALDLDAANEAAKSGEARIEAEQAKNAKKVEPAPAPPPVVTPVAPEFIDLGGLTENNAIKLVKPIYSQTAFKLNIGGKVAVAVELDDKGNVTSAKALNGSPYLRKDSEDAARSSKFHPATFNGQPIKAKGVVTYNFIPAR